MNDTKENVNWNVAYLTVKFVKALQKKEARKTNLSHSSNVSLRRYLNAIDGNEHYTSSMLMAKNKNQLIQSILEEEAIDDTIEEYSSQLENLGIDTKMLSQVASFGV